MRCLTKLSLLVGLTLSMISPGMAQATRTWVSGVGDDVNPCSRTAPCKTFAGAISKTAAGGEINCIDQGAYGAVTITKAITLECVGVTGGVLASSTNGIIINAGINDNVVLRGLDINGAPSGSPGLNGIRVLAAGSLVVDDCTIRNFKAAAPNGRGIMIATGNTFTFVVSNSRIYNNGAGSTGAGLQVFQTAGGVNGVIDKVVFAENAFGISLNGSTNTVGTNVTVRDSSISNSDQVGIIVSTGATNTSVMAINSSISNNVVGLSTSGAGAAIRIGSSTIFGNTTGISGTVLSYGNNQLNGNGTDGTLTPVPGGLH